MQKKGLGHTGDFLNYSVALSSTNFKSAFRNHDIKILYFIEKNLLLKGLLLVIKLLFFMITLSTLWKKALKCNVTFVNDPAFTSEYLRLQLLFVSLLCKSATPNFTPSLQRHPRLKKPLLASWEWHRGDRGTMKKGWALAPLATRAAATPCAASSCQAGENLPVKNTS